MALVQGEREHERVAEHEGDRVGVEQRRHQRFPPGAAQPLADVEHEIPARARNEPRGQRLRPPDALHRMASRAQHRRDRGDRLLGVELGELFGVEPIRRPIGGEVVGQADPHGSGYR